MMMIHSKKSKIQKCHLCDRSFSFESTLQKHIQSHKAIDNLDCDVCNKSFSNKRYLDRHSKLVHKRSLIIECGKCKMLKTSALKRS